MRTIQYLDKTIYIVSTAHVSKQSVIDVKESIETMKPDVVCIELDSNRAHALTNKQDDPDIRQIIKNKKVGSFVTNLILSSYQKKMANELESEVGGEMKQALSSAKEFNIPVRYIDRDVQITFKRIWGNLGFYKKAQLITTIIFSAFDDDEIDSESIENLKESDLLFEAVKELDDKLPEISKSLLHERNYFMAEKIKALPQKRVLAVVGAAHTEGIIEALSDKHSIADLNKIPEKKKNSINGWIIPGILLVLFTLLTLQSPELGAQKLLTWFLLSSGSATIGSLLVGAHPLTALVTLITAPIGTLSPFLAVGFFSGLTEAYLRPPKASDFENLQTEASQFKKWFTNRVLRILLIFIVTSLLSSIGTIIAGSSMITSLLN